MIYTAYRGEHGEACDEQVIQTRLGAISFGSEEAATIYATDPNNRNDEVIEPRVILADLTIANPVMNNPGDPFIDFSVISNAIGQDKAVLILKSVHENGHLTNTDNWSNVIEERGIDEYDDPLERMLEEDVELTLSQLYVDAYPIFDNHEWVDWFRQAGFDGVICGGTGVAACEPEYRVFDVSQIDVKEVVNVEECSFRMSM